MTYTCPFCKSKMLHFLHNCEITTNETLKVKIGDTFKCKCSISVIYNSWKYTKNGWFFLIKNPKVITDHKWVKQTKKVPFNKVFRFVFR